MHVEMSFPSTMWVLGSSGFVAGVFYPVHSLLHVLRIRIYLFMHFKNITIKAIHL